MTRRLSLALLLTIAACTPKTPVRSTVSLRMTGAPDDARVIIDDMYVGPLGAVIVRGVALPPGRHTISVERQGYFPCDQLATVAAGDPPLRVVCTLTAVPE